MVFDYTVQVVSKFKVAATLWALFRHPGRPTRDFMAGQRQPQVNPLWLFVFTWTTLTTVLLFASDHSGTINGALAESVPLTIDGRDLDVLFERVGEHEWIVWVIASYAAPVLRCVGIAAVARLFWTRSHLSAVVFGLHVGTCATLLQAPVDLLRVIVRSSLSGQLMSALLDPLFSGGVLIFVLLSARGAFELSGWRPYLLGALGQLVASVIGWILLFVITMVVWTPIVFYITFTEL